MGIIIDTKAEEVSNNSPELDKENGELIRRQAAIDAHCELCGDRGKCNCDICPDIEVFQLLPPAQQAAGDTISRDAALKTCYEGWNKDYREIARDIRNLPYTEIIHCKDCEFKKLKGVDYFCDHITGEEIMVSPNDHCSWAEREVMQ